jgi:hypothetical protein
MTLGRGKREVSLIVLGLSIILVTALFGARAQYPSGIYSLLVVVQIVVIVASAWTLGAAAIVSGAEKRKMLAVAALLLISPWLLFSLLPGLGTPWQATAAENQSRYIVLLAAAIAVGVGMVTLRQILVAAGETFYSTLGFAFILFATPLYLVWASILFEANFVKAHGGQLEPSVLFVTDFSDLLLYFGGLLTYLASAAFALSLGKSGSLGRLPARVMAFLSLVAVLFLIVRGPQFPNPAQALEVWYNIPGFVAGIPAIPWFIPCAIGIALLRRIGKESDLMPDA